mgnify:CR=1 FL=1
MPDHAPHPARLRPAVRAELRAPVAGFLREVSCDQGDRVSPSATVARLEVPDLDSQLVEQREEVREARARLRLLQIGARPDAFWTCRFDEKQLQRLGPTTVVLDLSEVIAGANAIPDADPDAEQIVRLGQLARRMARHGQRKLDSRNAAAVIDDPHHLQSALDDRNVDPRGAGVDRVLHQLLDDARRPLDDLAGGDAVDGFGRELADGHGRISFPICLAQGGGGVIPAKRALTRPATIKLAYGRSSTLAIRIGRKTWFRRLCGRKNRKAGMSAKTIDPMMAAPPICAISRQVLPLGFSHIFHRTAMPMARGVKNSPRTKAVRNGIIVPAPVNSLPLFTCHLKRIVY